MRRNPMFLVAAMLSAASSCASPPSASGETAFLVTHLSLGPDVGDAWAGIDLDGIDTQVDDNGSATCSEREGDKWSLMVPGEHGVDNVLGYLSLITYAFPRMIVRPTTRADDLIRSGDFLVLLRLPPRAEWTTGEMTGTTGLATVVGCNPALPSSCAPETVDGVFGAGSLFVPVGEQLPVVARQESGLLAISTESLLVPTLTMEVGDPVASDRLLVEDVRFQVRIGVTEGYGVLGGAVSTAEADRALAQDDWLHFFAGLEDLPSSPDRPTDCTSLSVGFDLELTRVSLGEP